MYQQCQINDKHYLLNIYYIYYNIKKLHNKIQKKLKIITNN